MTGADNLASRVPWLQRLYSRRHSLRSSNCRSDDVLGVAHEVACFWARGGGSGRLSVCPVEDGEKARDRFEVPWTSRAPRQEGQGIRVAIEELGGVFYAANKPNIFRAILKGNGTSTMGRFLCLPGCHCPKMGREWRTLTEFQVTLHDASACTWHGKTYSYPPRRQGYSTRAAAFDSTEHSQSLQPRSI